MQQTLPVCMLVGQRKDLRTSGYVCCGAFAKLPATVFWITRTGTLGRGGISGCGFIQTPPAALPCASSAAGGCWAALVVDAQRTRWCSQHSGAQRLRVCVDYGSRSESVSLAVEGCRWRPRSLLSFLVFWYSLNPR